MVIRVLVNNIQMAYISRQSTSSDPQNVESRFGKGKNWENRDRGAQSWVLRSRPNKKNETLFAGAGRCEVAR
jgi:hypothetical protein